MDASAGIVLALALVAFPDRVSPAMLVSYMVGRVGLAALSSVGMAGIPTADYAALASRPLIDAALFFSRLTVFVLRSCQGGLFGLATPTIAISLQDGPLVGLQLLAAAVSAALLVASMIAAMDCIALWLSPMRAMGWASSIRIIGLSTSIITLVVSGSIADPSRLRLGLRASANIWVDGALLLAYQAALLTALSLALSVHGFSSRTVKALTFRVRKRRHLNPYTGRWPAELRAAAILMPRHLYGDTAIRLGLVPIFTFGLTAMAAPLLLGITDPFTVDWPDPSVWAINAFVAVCPVLVWLAIGSSDCHRAAWVFKVCPTNMDRFGRTVSLISTMYCVVPFIVGSFLLILLTLVNPVHWAIHLLVLSLAAGVTAEVMAIVRPGVPMSQPSPTAGVISKIARDCAVSFTIASAAIFLLPIVYGSAGAVVLSIIGVAATRHLVIRSAAGRTRRRMQPHG